MQADIAFGNQISEATLRRSRRRRSRRRRVAAAAALPDITFRLSAFLEFIFR